MPRIPYFVGDRLQVLYACSAAPTRLVIRLLTETLKGELGKGPMIEITTFTTDRTQIATLSEPFTSNGWIVGMSCDGNPGTLKRGQCYVMVSIARESEARLLAKGYFYQNGPLGFLEFHEPGPGGGEGNIRSIALANPAAGSDYADTTVDTNALWKLHGFAGQLVQGATQTPRARILILDGTNVVLRMLARSAQSSSTTTDYTIGDGFRPDEAASTATFAEGTIHGAYRELLLPEGYIIRFSTIGIGANSDWGAGRLLVEEWLVV